MFQLQLTVLDYLVLAAAGIAAGYTGGLLGLGGGVIMVPVLFEILPHLIGPHPQTAQIAVATSLGCVFFTSLSSAQAHNRKGNVDWKLAAMAAPMSAAGAFSVTLFALKISGIALKIGFGIFLAAMAARLWFFDPGSAKAGEFPPEPDRLKALVIGALIGTIGALFGIGGGSLAVPAFVLLMKRPVHQAVGTSSVLGACSGLVGSIGYLLAKPAAPVPGAIGIVIPLIVALLAAITILLAQVGARHAARIEPTRLRHIFAVALFLIGSLVVYRAV